MARGLTSALAVTLVAAMTAADGLAQSPAAPAPAAIVAAARDVIGKARYATLVTVDRDGQPQARIVDPVAPEADWSVWVSTNARSRKAAQLEANPRVTLLYFDAARESYVTLVGAARLVRDPAEKAKRWREEWKPFYKNGYRDEDFLLIRVEPQRLEISSPALGMNNDPITWRPVTLDLRQP